MHSLGITVLSSGSSGNATLVHTETEAVLIDAGLSFRELKKRLKAVDFPSEHIKAIVVTHEHSDHISGLRVCSEGLNVPIYATRLCADKIRQKDSKLQSVLRFEAGSDFSIGDITVTSFSIKHDAIDPVAYTFSTGNCKVGVATDMGSPSLTTDYNLRNCNGLVLESNHDLNMLAASSRPWHLKQRILSPIGHLSNPTACEVLQKLLAPQTQKLILAHISRECNTYNLAFDTAKDKLGALSRNDIELNVATQDTPLHTIWCD